MASHSKKYGYGVTSATERVYKRMAQRRLVKQRMPMAIGMSRLTPLGLIGLVGAGIFKI